MHPSAYGTGSGSDSHYHDQRGEDRRADSSPAGEGPWQSPTSLSGQFSYGERPAHVSYYEATTGNTPLPHGYPNLHTTHANASGVPHFGETSPLEPTGPSSPFYTSERAYNANFHGPLGMGHSWSLHDPAVGFPGPRTLPPTSFTYSDTTNAPPLTNTPMTHPQAGGSMRPGIQTSTPCEWEGCGVELHDDTSNGIRKHLREYHFHEDPPTPKTRLVCRWGTSCRRDSMLWENLPKHIAECHTKSMQRTCPQCGDTFARSDTLKRHVDSGGCPRDTGRA